MPDHPPHPLGPSGSFPGDPPRAIHAPPPQVGRPREGSPGTLRILASLWIAALLACVLAAPAGASPGPDRGLGPAPDTTLVEPDRSVLTVSAMAEVEAAPDRARISFAVETEAESARDAGEANARLMDRVMEAVQATGLPGLRTETSGYQLTPRYQVARADQPRVIIGYTARNHLLVTVDDVDEVGRLLDLALDAGANRVAGLSFEVRDPEPHRQDALRQAVAKARAEAETVAGALGVTLGVPLEVQSGSFSQPRQQGVLLRAEGMAMADAPTTPVEAGLQTISANVNIRFRIHP